MKYKLRGSAEHLNQLWKQTHLSDLINLTQFGSLWIKRLPDWFAMLQFLTNTVCIGEELLACSTRGNALFNLLKWVHLSCFLLQDSVVIAELKKPKRKVNPVWTFSLFSVTCVNWCSLAASQREVTHEITANENMLISVSQLVPPILGRVVTPSLTFSSLLAESGLHGQQGGVHIHRELADCMIYTYWLPPAVTIARAKARHA